MQNQRIYVGTYKKYNEGSIYGAWLDLDDYSDFDELMEAMRTLHKDEEDPEFMFQDYECLEIIEDLELISEGHISEEIYDVLEAIENSGYDVAIIEAYTYCTNNLSSDIQDILTAINHRYVGEYSNDKGFVQEQLKVAGYIPENLPDYMVIDWERTASNLMFDYCSHNNHYFRSV